MSSKRFDEVSTDNKRLISMIHIAKTQLGMAEESYRAHLKFYGNKNSCKTMSTAELNRVLDGMKTLGFKAQPSKVKATGTSSGKPKPFTDERSVIRAIWTFMANAGFIKDGTDTALNEWVKRQTAAINNGAGIANIEWLPHEQAVYVLESLKKWNRRCLYSALEKKGHELWPQIGYQQLMTKWERATRSQA